MDALHEDMNGWVKTAALGFSIIATLGACELGGMPDDTSGNDDYERIPGDEDDILDQLFIICESELVVTGTLDVTQERPAGVNGCWDVGVWNITSITTDKKGCEPTPDFVDTFVYTVTRNDEDQAETEIVYEDDPDGERLNLKITSSGDGLCHGSFAHFYEDNTVLTLQPTLNDDGTLSGIGTFTVHEDDPF